MNVYKRNGRRVVLIGRCGDNFGTMQDIDTGETFTTYGYNSMNFNKNTRIGTVKTKTVYFDFKED